MRRDCYSSDVRDASDLESIFDETPWIAAAWVFGSVARGEQRPDSDLDVAVLLAEAGEDAVTKRRELLDLTARLESAAGRRVDLAVLTLRDPILAHRVLSEGRLVKDADPDRRVDFTTDALARYFDWAPLYEAAAARSLRANRKWARERARRADG